MATVFALGASAQSVIIYDKEGQAHKYNTDRVSDITFVKPGQIPQEISFSTLDVSPYSGGYCDMVFTTDDGRQLTLYVCGPKSTVWLADGVYNVEASNDPMTVDTDPDWSFYVDGENRTSPVSGSMTVSRAEALYTISIDFEMSDDSRLLASWEGEIPNYSPFLTIPDAAAATVVEIRDQVPGEFYIKLNDSSYIYEMAVDFFAAAGSARLPEGTYTASDDNTPFTYSTRSYMNFYSPYASLTFQGPIEVSYVGEEIRMVMNLQFSDGRQGTVIYQGQIDFPPVETPRMDFSSVSVTPYSGGYADMEFKTGDKTLMLYVCGPKSTTWLADGDYNVEASNAPMTVDTDPDWSYYTDGANTSSPVSGTMSVSRQGAIYTILFDFAMSDGTDLSARFVGELPNYSPFLTLQDAESATVMEVRDQLAGEYYIKMVGPNSKYEWVVDFYADASTTRLPEGTYTYSDDKTPGTYGPSSSMTMYGPYSSNTYTGPVTVSYQGDNITISGELALADGRSATVKYVGAIEFPQPQGDLFVSVSTPDTWNGGAAMKLSVDEDTFLYVECWFPDGSVVWPEGTYTLDSSMDNFTIDNDPYYSYYSEDDQTTGLASGSMTVSQTDGIYTMDVDMTLSDGRTLNGSYHGPLSGNFSVNVQLEPVRCSETYLSDKTDGEFYLSLSNQNYKQEMRLDLVATPGSTTLPAGTYTYSTEKTPGTFGSASLVEFYGPYFHSYAQPGSTATVSYDGDQVVIEMHYVLTDGRQANGTYRGTITYNN